jgi:hypothetical protein
MALGTCFETRSLQLLQIQTLFEFVGQHSKAPKDEFQLMNSYPRRIFTEADWDATLKSSDLVPQATLVVSLGASSQAHKAAPLRSSGSGVTMKQPNKVESFFQRLFSKKDKPAAEKPKEKPAPPKTDERSTATSPSSIEGMSRANVHTFKNL